MGCGRENAGRPEEKGVNKGGVQVQAASGVGSAASVCNQVTPRGFPGTLECGGASGSLLTRTLSSRPCSKARKQQPSSICSHKGLRGRCFVTPARPLAHIPNAFRYENDLRRLGGRSPEELEGYLFVNLHACVLSRVSVAVHLSTAARDGSQRRDDGGVLPLRLQRRAPGSPLPTRLSLGLGEESRCPLGPTPEVTQSAPLTCGHIPCIPNKWIRDPLRSADTTSSEHAGGSGGRGQHCAR